MCFRRRRGAWGLILIVGMFSLGSVVLAQDSRPTIGLGMSTVLSGAAADLGRSVKAGFELALSEWNSSAAPAAPLIDLKVLDDGYEPLRCAPNMHQLLDRDNVTAVVGNVGTPTAATALPIAKAAKALLYCPVTGSGLLRKTPPDRYVINFRASYAEETAAMVDALIEHRKLKVNEIAFFTQRDSYGDSGYHGGIAALKRHGLVDENCVIHACYDRNTVAIENAVADIMTAKVTPKAVIMVGVYAPTAAFVRMVKSLGLAPLFLSVSFVGTKSLARELGGDGNGVIVTQVVPHYESDLPIAKDYRAALSKYGAEDSCDFGSFEGYIAGRILTHAVKNHHGRFDREGLIEALHALGRFDIGLGVELEISPERHQASRMVWPTVLNDGHILPFDWAALAASPRDR